jgi:hypothetical protein
MGKMRNAYRILVGKPEDLDVVGGKMILQQIFERYDGMVWTRFIWFGIRTSRGLSRTRK